MMFQWVLEMMGEMIGLSVEETGLVIATGIVAFFALIPFMAKGKGDKTIMMLALAFVGTVFMSILGWYPPEVGIVFAIIFAGLIAWKVRGG